MTKQVVIGKNLIFYADHGNQNAEHSVVFLHGWRSEKEIWQSIFSKIRPEGWRILAIDFPGFGQSPFPKSTPPSTPPHIGALNYEPQSALGGLTEAFRSSPPWRGDLEKPFREKDSHTKGKTVGLSFRNSHTGEGSGGGWTVGDYANLVLGFLEKLQLKNVVLVGHSFGGRVAIKLASNISKLPPLSVRGGQGVICKVVLVDAAGFPMNAGRKTLFGFLAKLVKPFFKPEFMQGLRKRIYRLIGAEDYLATPNLQKTFVNITAEDLTEDMKRINVPTLIVTGENDQDTPVHFGQKMNSLIHNSKFIILPKAGHFSFVDQPEEFVKNLKNFLQTPQ